MAIDKSKILKSAEKYVASGKTSQAIEEYEKILKEHPKEWNVMIQVGDLKLRMNKPAEAIGHFQTVANHYYNDGFFLKAIAIYKRINKLDPNLTEICNKLADLYLKQGLTMDAKSQLQIVAQHYLTKNQNKDAIQTLKRMIEIEPDNLRTRNELAKSYKIEGMIPEAVKEYQEISEVLTRKNMHKESLAVLETAYKLDSKNTEILRKILTFYSEQKEPLKAAALLEEAVQMDPMNPDVLALLAESYAEKKQFAKAQETIDRAVVSTSKPEPFLTIKGDIYLKSGDMANAFAQYSQVVEKLIQRRELEKALPLLHNITRADSTFPPVWQKLVEIYGALRQQSNLIEALTSLVDAYLSKQMYEEASKYLVKLIGLEPEDSQHRDKLVFVKSVIAKTKPSYRAETAAQEYEVEASVTREPEAEEPMRRIVMETQRQVATPQFQPQPRVAPKPAAPAAMITEAPQEERDFVSEHLIEVEVFNKYGLIDKAIEQLQTIIGRYPGNVGAHQKLKEIYLEKGERDKAVEECVFMSRILRKQGDLDQVEDLLSEARQINPNHPSLEKAYKELPVAPKSTDVLGEIEKLAQSIKTKSGSFKIPRPAPQKPTVPPPGLEVEEIEIQIEEPEPEKVAQEGSFLPDDSFEEIDFYAGQGLIAEARDLLSSLKEKYPSDPGVLRRLARLTGEPPPPLPSFSQPTAQNEAPIEFREQDVKPSGIEIPAALPEKVVEEVEAEGLEDEISIDTEEFGEASEENPQEIPLLLEEGDEAILLGAGESSTDLPDLPEAPVEPMPEALELEKVEVEGAEFIEVEGSEGTEEIPSTPAPAPVFDHESFNAAVEAAFEKKEEQKGREKEIETPEPIVVKTSEELFEQEDDFFDLAAELEEGFLNVQSAVEEEKPADGQNYTIEEILSDFKKGVEKQLGAEDYDTRYNLGIAYKEMGLVDEAIAEFQIAAKDPQRFLECCSMLGLCFVEKGMPKLAIKWYQRGLETQGHSEEEYLGLRFELALAQEACGDLEQAVETYQEVYSMNANYRNVAKKVKELQEQLKSK